MVPSFPRRTLSLSPPAALVAATLALGSLLTPTLVHAEPAACLSPDPNAWPSPSRPYFMVVVDTSGSMGLNVGSVPSCAGYQGNRIGHARCAVKNTVLAYSGEVNFGLGSYTWKETACSNATCGACGSGACFPQCTATFPPGNDNFCGPFIAEPTLGLNVHSGGLVLVPMLQDHFWSAPPDPTNAPAMLGYVDNNCGNSEIGAAANTPLGGVLFNMNQYFAGTYHDQFTGAAVPSPLGTVAQGERPCRSLNIILITDGDESCDFYNTGTYPTNEGLAVYEANRLYANGINFGGQNFSVKVHVIGFIGATIASLDHIAAAGGTTASYSTANEAQLSLALAKIISGAIKPETCDNTDNNCNGCTDEGFTHYCDNQPVAADCCAWNTDPERAACLTSYTASISPALPKGTLSLLPCTTPAQQADPTHWLCYDPGEKCDSVDNNCVNGVDENVVKCGNPLHCPQPEVCNGLDDDCNGLPDDGIICPVACGNPSPEICDGCDNDCDGFTDNGVASIPCGLVGPGEPPNCAGVITCKPPVAVTPGTCAPGGGFNACNNMPLPELCDNIDNNCNGIIDDNVASTPCLPPGTPPGLDYGPNSGCKQGHTVCTNGMTTCVGYIGPGAEICDGIDNNCNGTVDESVPGIGLQCGINQPPCTPGLTACVGGAIVCQGGFQPQPEICDGIDNNCNGVVDESPLSDAPAPGMNGCWDQPGNCCAFKNLHWCPPPGGTCTGDGSLKAPCNQGTLVCAGAGGWICQGPKDPTPEVCDGLDNDCNGLIDDGNLPQVGTVCGINKGECKQGVIACTVGVLACVGSVGPTMELCDGLDNDCDGVIDNGISVGGPCTPAYDTMAYPGDRSSAPCHPGVLLCDGMGGQTCLGGIGPSPEVCDGIDNDCDGKVDETGPAPDGVDGSANPNPPPDGNIGDACGVNVGECKQGLLACQNGMFSCFGGQQSAPETCDCKDNDCDGKIDNPSPNPLCSMGKDCVKSSSGSCQCAAPCGSGEFKCPPGQKCDQVTDSMSGQSLPTGYCVTDFCAEGCTTKTLKDANGKVICAPAGTTLDGCITPPICACKDQNGCQDPCLGVMCPAGQVCAELGVNAGKCALDNCWNNPCQGCGKVCDLGACMPDPCTPTSCPLGQECKPNAMFTGFDCVPACSTVTCASGKTCVDGVCVNDCTPMCGADQVCDLTKAPPVCGQNKCKPDSCADGSCCNPVTGACGNCPCEGVLCPVGDACDKITGQCGVAQQGAGAGGNGAGGTDGAGPTSSGSTGGKGGRDDSIWGLATGGGGCACEVGAGAGTAEERAAQLFGLALLGLAARRKRSPRAGKEVAS